MPERPLTIATYAAGASLAAITLVYVFGPTFFLDDDAAQSSRSNRKKGVVGLLNPANDCFINSVLQTLAGLPELRVYLIRELHRRRLDGQGVYEVLPGHNDGVAADEDKNGQDEEARRDQAREPDWKVLGLQKGMVTAALKDILDALNERPIYKKTISAQSFVGVLEHAFRTRISRQQQDAQEFLQIVTERLGDEYHAGGKARKKAKKVLANDQPDGLAKPGLKTTEPTHGVNSNADEVEETTTTGDVRSPSDAAFQEQSRSSGDGHPSILQQRAVEKEAKPPDEAEDSGFPFEGQIESQIECMHCHFKPKPAVSSFVTLTLNVPQATSTSLNACFDGMLKVEHIDDFKCDRCRLQHALESKQHDLARASRSEKPTSDVEDDIKAIEHALATDPEVPPKGVTLPDMSLAPKRRITRHMRISSFPRVLALHLSRSMWAAGISSTSTKNMAKVSFPETLPLGGLLDQVSYRLLGVVTHKGGHNSGHYESFRRQVLKEPFSTRASLGKQGVYSHRNSAAGVSPRASAATTAAGGSPALASIDESRTQAAANGGDAATEQSTSPEVQASLPSPSNPSESSLSLDSSRSSISTPRKKRWSHNRDTPSAPTEIITASPTTSKTPIATATSIPPTPTTTTTIRRPSLRSRATNGSANGSVSKAATATAVGAADMLGLKRRANKPNSNRWWRISDDKIKESKTSEVLSMQREVYLLFYEMVPRDEGG